MTTDSVDLAGPKDVRRLDLPSALALADLTARFDDLQVVLGCCERLVSQLTSERGGPDALTVEALWTLALSSYFRCFQMGERGMGLTLDDVVATGLGEEVPQWHRVLEELHRHHTDPVQNPREAFTVGVTQDEAGAASGIAVTSLHQPQVDEVTVRQTGAVAFALSKILDERINEQQQRVFKAVQAMTTAELEKLPLVEVAQPEGQAVPPG